MCKALEELMAERKFEMQFLVLAYDGKNKLQKRLEVRARHLSNLSSECSHNYDII